MNKDNNDLFFDYLRSAYDKDVEQNLKGFKQELDAKYAKRNNEIVGSSDMQQRARDQNQKDYNEEYNKEKQRVQEALKPQYAELFQEKDEDLLKKQEQERYPSDNQEQQDVQEKDSYTQEFNDKSSPADLDDLRLTWEDERDNEIGDEGIDF